MTSTNLKLLKTANHHTIEAARLTIEAMRHQTKSKQHLAETTRIAEEAMTIEE